MAAKTYNAGTIFLQVVPVFGDTMRAIKREAENANKAWGDEAEKAGKDAGERAGKAQGEAMVKEARKSARQAGEEYGGHFQESIKGHLRGAQREIDKLNFKTLSADAEDRVKRIGKLFNELDAEIDVDMDDKKLRAKLDFLKADLRKLKEGKHELHIDENLDFVIGKVEGGLKVIDKALDKRRVIQIETKISDRDLGSFEKKLRDTAKRSAKALGDSLDPAVKKLKARLDSLGDAEIGIDISAAAARAEIVSIDKALMALPKEVDVDLGVNSTVAHAELLAFREAVNAIDGLDVDIPVKVNGTGKAVAEMAAVTAASGGMKAALMGAFQAGSGGAENAANSFRSFNFAILAAVTLVPALIPMIGALGGGLLALIPILGAVGAGIGVMLVGFSGIGDAVGALGDVQENAAKDSLSAGKTMTAAANAVADAERALGEARRAGGEAIADAQRALADAHEAAADAIEEALKRQKDAQEDYRDAVKDVTEAEKDLKAAREEAQYTLLDLDNKVEQNQIDIGQGVIDVFNAQANFNAVMSDGSATNQDKDAAALALQEAELQLKELRQEQEKLAKEKAKADKKGVESTDEVQTAQEQLTAALEAQQDAQENLAESAEDVAQTRADAADQIADAERNLARARASAARQVAAAERNLAQAQQGLADAAEQTGEIGSASMQKLEKAMDKLGPSGRKFAKFLFSLKSGFYDVRDSIQEALLPPVQHAMEQIISKYGPQMKAFAVRMGATIGGLFEKLGNRMSKSPAWQKFFATMGRLGPDLMGNFGLTIINFMTAFASIMTAVAPFSERLSVAMVKISQAFANWAGSADGTQQIQDFMAYAAKVGPEVVGFFVNLLGAIVNIGKAIAPWGEMVMNAISGMLGFIASMDPKTLGTITMAIITLVVAFQAAVGIVALAYAGAAVFATTAGTTVFAVIALAGVLLSLYHNFESVRNVVDATGAFLKDHIDLLIDIVKYVGAAVVAYKAWKAITAAVKAVQIGFLAATALSTGAIDANTAATYANTKAGKLGMIAGKAWRVVTLAAAAAQWLLNAAMAGNPFVLIGLLVIALVATIIYLWKTNETFRKIVIKIWNVLKDTAVKVFGAIKAAFWATVEGIKSAWEFLKPIFAAIWAAIKFLWEHVFKPYLTLLWNFWSSVFKGVAWVVMHILVPIIDLIAHIIVKLWKVYFKAYLFLIKNAWKVLVFAIKAYWNHYLKPILSAFGTAVKWLWEKFVKPNLPKIVAGWNLVKDAVHKAWDKWIKPAIEGFKTAMGGLKSKVETVVGFIKTAWDGIKTIFATPIVFVVDTILNNGLIAGFNKIAKFVGSKEMSTIPLSDDIRNMAAGGKAEKHARGGIIGRGNNTYATGGTLPGYTPGQDVHHFVSPTAGSLHLSGGEAIMRPEFTSVVGSGWVDKMNLIARAEGKSGIKRVMGGDRFAKGGIFFPLPHGVMSTYAGHDGVDINAPGDENGHTPFYSATSGTVNYVGYDRGYGNAIFINSPYGELVYGHGKDGTHGVHAGSPVNPGTYLAMVGATEGSAHVTGPHLHFGFPGGSSEAARALLSGADPGIKAHGGGGGISIPGWLKGFLKGPVDYMKNIVSKPLGALKDKFGNNDMIKTLASIPVKLAKSVADKALSIVPGPIKAAAKGLGAVAEGAGDLAGGALDAVGLKKGGILPYNGTMKYDSGGYLPPGLTSVVNLTGKPEPVFTHDQFDNMGGSGETFHYEPHFEGSDLTPGDIVRDMDHARRKMRREGRYARSH